ncbi:MAG: S41 family peptidase [Anaerolineales bacterium]
MKRLLWIILSLAIFIPSCVPSTPTATPTQKILPSPAPFVEAQQYLSDALDIIQKNALNSRTVDWEQVRATVFSREKDAKISSETYDSIDYVIQQLNDYHSAFIPPDAANQMNSSTVEEYPAPEGKIIENKIGYIAVFSFNAQNENEINKYAESIQKILIELDKKSVCGWVVDLREDSGGNMYPMIAGLGALIGEGELGYFKNAMGQVVPWKYEDGEAKEGDHSHAKVSHPDFLFDPATTPVAVLIGPQTASAGEATTISFLGRPNTRLFGASSYGLTSGNDSFALADGAIIILATVTELDRTGQEHIGVIAPDVITPHPEAEATDWLLTKAVCQ